MTTIKPRDLNGDAAQLLKSHVLVLLTYCGIVAAFAVTTLLGYVIWLLIW